MQMQYPRGSKQAIQLKPIDHSKLNSNGAGNSGQSLLANLTTSSQSLAQNGAGQQGIQNIK